MEISYADIFQAELSPASRLLPVRRCHSFLCHLCGVAFVRIVFFDSTLDASSHSSGQGC